MRISRYIAGLATIGLAALAAIVPAKPAAAQTSAFAFSSSFQVQNLSTTAASISIAFYNLDAAAPAVSVDDSIPGSGQKTYATLPSQVADGFNGSAVISSDQRVAAIVNINSPSLSNLTFGGEAYVGVTEGSTSASLPLLFKASFNFNSFFNVQNVGQNPASVVVTYAGGGLTTPLVKPAVTIAPGAATRFNVDAETGLPAGFNGSATITSTGSEIAAVATHVGPTTLLIYNSFSSGSTNPVFPLVNANNSGYITGIALQNRGNTATNVTMTYTASLAGANCTETKSVPAGGSAFFAITAFAANDTNADNTCANGATFVGSARVTTNSANMELVGTVDQVNSAARKGGTYAGFNPADATNVVVYPLINDRNFGFFTGLSIVNTGNVATNIECVYSGTAVKQSATNVPPGGTFTPVQANQLANGYNGSGTCTSSAAGATIVGIGQQLRPTGNASTFYVYEGTNSN